jgi:biopolymer transport protein ExbD
MKIERQKKRNAEVYTASLNDIMFFLLLFFLIISTMVTPSIVRVMLPNASAAKNMTMKKTLQMVITDDLHYYIDNKEVSFDEIEPELTKILNSKQEDEEINVVLQADKNLNLQPVVDIINIGYQLNIKIVLFVEKD